MVRLHKPILISVVAAVAGLSTHAVRGEDPITIRPVNENGNNNAASANMAFPLADLATNDTDPRESPDNSKVAWKTPFGQLKWEEISNKIVFEGEEAFVQHNGLRLKLTIRPHLQQLLERQFALQRHISGAMVLLESRTGRILAMAEKRGEVSNPLLTSKTILTSATAPAASLMKIVTASAAIEKSNLDPELDVPFHGGCGHLRGQNWLRDAKQDRQHMDLALAFGKSCNTVFARVAIYHTGLLALSDMADRYMFNKPISSDLFIETSAAFLPSPETATPYEVGMAGAGFGASRLSPIHSAMLSAATGNGGMLMSPFLVESATDAKGAVVYRGTPKPIARLFSANTAAKMAVLMQETITAGTSRRYFRRKGTRKDLFDIGGKTGTLSDPEDRQILYTWFSGVAPLDTPNSVAIGTLVASPQNWLVRASSLAQAGLAEYLKMERNAARVASANQRK